MRSGSCALARGAWRRPGVFARAERLLAASATAVAARAVTHDAVSFPFSQAGIGEGLAIAAMPGADRLVLHGAKLRMRPGRARPGPIVDDHRTGRQQRGQDEIDSALTRDRKKSHLSLLHPGSVAPARDILAFRGERNRRLWRRQAWPTPSLAHAWALSGR
jgi:hypothetical protein